MAEFVPIPKIPQQDVSPWMYAVLTALAENMELVMGVRTENVRAVTSDSITVIPQAYQLLKRITADGASYTAPLPGGAQVPALSDYVKLAQDVQAVINDLARIESALNTLLAQLRR